MRHSIWRSFQNVVCGFTGNQRTVDQFGCHKGYDGVIRGANIINECHNGQER